MKNDRKSKMKRERLIMIGASAFVLTALTMTGVYMRSQNDELQDNGYKMDLPSMENTPSEKLDEIARTKEILEQVDEKLARVDENTQEIEDDLDYLPEVGQVGSGKVEIPGLTDGKTSAQKSTKQESLWGSAGKNNTKEAPEEILPTPEEAIQEMEETPERELHFGGPGTLQCPVEGQVLMPFSMKQSIYFKTLDQYKYHPAMVFSAPEGTGVFACGEGKILDIHEDSVTGCTLVLDLGDGVMATYGQLKDLNGAVGNYVNCGDLLGYVAAPTKYYSLEGPNLYFALEQSGTPVDPADYF